MIVFIFVYSYSYLCIRIHICIRIHELYRAERIAVYIMNNIVMNIIVPVKIFTRGLCSFLCLPVNFVLVLTLCTFKAPKCVFFSLKNK